MSEDAQISGEAAAGQQGIEELAETFEFLDDWEERYRYIIDLGKKLPPLPEEYKTEDYRVQGCVSKVWLVPRADPADPNRIFFDADSDSHIVKGLIAIALMLFSDRTPEEILAVDAREVLKRLDLSEHLSPSRSNGFYAMIRRIRQTAERRLHGYPIEQCAIIQ